MRVALRADGPALIQSAKAMRRVEDQADGVRAGHRFEGVYIGRVAEIVNGDYGGRAGCDGGFGCRRVEVGRAEIHIRKHWPEPCPFERADGRHESKAWDYDIAGQPQTFVSEHKPCSAA